MHWAISAARPGASPRLLHCSQLLLCADAPSALHGCPWPAPISVFCMVKLLHPTPPTPLTSHSHPPNHPPLPCRSPRTQPRTWPSTRRQTRSSLPARVRRCPCRPGRQRGSYAGAASKKGMQCHGLGPHARPYPCACLTRVDLFGAVPASLVLAPCCARRRQEGQRRALARERGAV